MPGPMGPPPGGGRGREIVKPKDAKKTLGKILAYMGKSKLFLIMVVFALILSTACQLGASYWLKPILDSVAQTIKAGTFATEGVHQLIRNLIIVGAFYVGSAGFTFLQSRIMVKIAYKDHKPYPQGFI